MIEECRGIPKKTLDSFLSIKYTKVPDVYKTGLLEACDYQPEFISQLSDDDASELIIETSLNSLQESISLMSCVDIHYIYTKSLSKTKRKKYYKEYKNEDLVFFQHYVFTLGVNIIHNLLGYGYNPDDLKRLVDFYIWKHDTEVEEENDGCAS